MMGNNQNLFFSPEEKGRAFSDVLKEVQEYISSKYSTLMVEGGNDEVKQQVKPCTMRWKPRDRRRKRYQSPGAGSLQQKGSLPGLMQSWCRW